jgi:hypothetical protein
MAGLLKIALYKTFPTALLQSFAPTFTVPSFRQKIFQKCYPMRKTMHVAAMPFSNQNEIFLTK